MNDLVISADTFNELLFKVNGYIKANGLVVEGSRIDWLQDQICEQNSLPENYCTKV